MQIMSASINYLLFQLILIVLYLTPAQNIESYVFIYKKFVNIFKNNPCIFMIFVLPF